MQHNSYSVVEFFEMTPRCFQSRQKVQDKQDERPQRAKHSPYFRLVCVLHHTILLVLTKER